MAVIWGCERVSMWSVLCRTNGRQYEQEAVQEAVWGRKRQVLSRKSSINVFD